MSKPMSEAPAAIVLYPEHAWALTPEPSDSPEQTEYVRKDIYDTAMKAVDAYCSFHEVMSKESVNVDEMNNAHSNLVACMQAARQAGESVK